MTENAMGPTGNDLGNRLISAAGLMPFGLYVVWAGNGVLLAGCGLFAVIMAYEWVRISSSPSLPGFVALSIAPFVMTAIAGTYAGVASLIVCAPIAGFLHPLKHKWSGQGFGFVYVTIMPFAFYALREGPWDGMAMALLVMLIVWGSDSAAYFAGRFLGGPGLHADSPKKTWSGAISAIIFSMLCGLVAALVTGGNKWAWVATGGLISIVGQLGDLLESTIKRRFHVKDTSRLLPGHGGIMDRVDGLGPVCVCVLVLFLTVPAIVGGLGVAS